MLGCSYFNNKVFKLDDITIVRQPCGARALISECAFSKEMPRVDGVMTGAGRKFK